MQTNPLYQEAKTDYPTQSSEKKKTYSRKLLTLLTEAENSRKTPLRILNDRSLEEYWQDSEQRWLGIIPKKRRKAWQSAVVKPITRIKCIGVIANLVDMFVQPDFFAYSYAGDENELIADIVGDLYELATEREKGERKYMQALIDAVSIGTGFVQENYVNRRMPKKEVGDWDPDTGEISYKEKMIIDFEGPESEVVSPYEIYLGNIFEEDIQKQPYIFRKFYTTYEQAKTKFGRYKDFEYVVPGSYTAGDYDDDGKYFEIRTSNVDNSNIVEVVYYWSRVNDEAAIMINGVVITEVGAPIPYAHKKYPFAKVMYEVMSNRFAYGKSLPDRLRGEQDIVDTLYRMIIDKTFLSIFPPMIARGGDRFTADIIAPGRITPSAEDTEIDVPRGVANGIGNEFNVVAMLENSMSQSSLDAQVLGTPASGERSATQTMAMQQGAQRLLGLFAHMVAYMVEDLAMLRSQNILQFWASYTRLVNKDDEIQEVDSAFEITNRVLEDGRTGNRRIEFVMEDLIEEPESLMSRAEQMNKPTEIVQIDPEYIRNFSIVIKVKANPTERLSPGLERALAMEMYTTFANNPAVDINKLTREVFRSMNKDPDEYFAQQQPQLEQEIEAPMGNVSNQMRNMAQPDMQQLMQNV